MRALLLASLCHTLLLAGRYGNRHLAEHPCSTEWSPPYGKQDLAGHPCSTALSPKKHIELGPLLIRLTCSSEMLLLCCDVSRAPPRAGLSVSELPALIKPAHFGEVFPTPTFHNRLSIKHPVAPIDILFVRLLEIIGPQPGF